MKKWHFIALGVTIVVGMVSWSLLQPWVNTQVAKIKAKNKPK